MGGQAILIINENLICHVAVINTARFDIHLERWDFIGAVETLLHQAAAVQSIKALPIPKIIHKIPVEPVSP